MTSTGERLAHGIGPAGIDVAYECFGDADAVPVLLIMGGGAQLINWPEGFCAALADNGMYVIRYDNRDTGRSTHFPDAPEPDFRAAMAGDTSSASYSLSDMADDALGLLDALGIAGAHLVGASLGGMIAQTIALEHPSRVRSLTSMMSTTGDLSVGQPDFAAIGSLGPAPTDRAGFVDWQVRALRAVGSPGFAFDEAAMAQRAGRTFDRGHDPAGMLRHSLAALASGDRTPKLATLRLPTLVMHGDSDLMIDLSGGRATATAIPGAELVTFAGMGHGLPRELWPEFVARITELVRRAEAQTASKGGE